MSRLCYFTYLVVGIVGIVCNAGGAGGDTLLSQFLMIAFMIFGAIVFAYLTLIVIVSLVKCREIALFGLGLATLAELALQIANSSVDDNELIYYALAFPYFIGIAAVSAYKLFFSKMPQTEAG